MTDYTDYTD